MGKGIPAAHRRRTERRMIRFRAIWLASALVFCTAQSLGEQAPAPLDDHGQLRNPVLQTRFERITKELRCLVCQNESIADSNVDLAADLRRQVREMLIAGKSDDAIFAFMTDRYGEFVRFNPPLEPKTLLIWGAPFIMLFVGVAIIYRVVRQRSRLPLDDEPASGPM
jgi:cytochrome c-type biogenesis protein CcmH